MKKELILRCLLGAPVGLTICTLITIGFSLGLGEGRYMAVVPELTAACGSEIGAVVLQTLGAMLYGAFWAGASLIWNQEHWSILKQTITHLMLCSLVTFPVAYLMRWMPRNLLGAAAYFGVFLTIYALIWLSKYLPMKRSVQQMDRSVRQRNAQHS